MVTRLRDHLKNAVSTESRETLLSRMGYRVQSDQAWARLYAVLASPSLELDASH